jgi:hypothetical protein
MRTVTYKVNTSNSAGVPTDLIWQFMAIGRASQLAGAPAPLESGETDACHETAGATCE